MALRTQIHKLIGAAVLSLALSAAGGCGGSDQGSGPGELHVYVSVPLRGASGVDGRSIANGARLALADASGEAAGIHLEASYLDDTAGRGPDARWDAATVGENARTATEDSTAIAYIGEFESGATRTSLPITNQAGLLQVSPASTAVDLVADQPGSAGPVYQPSGERNFGRVIPADDVQRAAANEWSKRVRRPVAITFAGEPFPAKAGAYFTSAAEYPGQLPAAGRQFVRAYALRFDAKPSPYGAYGYEAMAVVLDSIGRATDPTSRGSVIDAFFATADRDSVLGTYSIDDLGDTTLRSIAGYRVRAGGEPAFYRPLEAP
jgi:ABC-type branched-subunit amino acid transport system substrate-binding protein